MEDHLGFWNFLDVRVFRDLGLIKSTRLVFGLGLPRWLLLHIVSSSLSVAEALCTYLFDTAIVYYSGWYSVDDGTRADVIRSTLYISVSLSLLRRHTAI